MHRVLRNAGRPPRQAVTTEVTAGEYGYTRPLPDVPTGSGPALPDLLTA